MHPDWSAEFIGGACAIITSGDNPSNLASRVDNSSSLYSPGVLNGVGFEYPKPAICVPPDL